MRLTHFAFILALVAALAGCANQTPGRDSQGNLTTHGVVERSPIIFVGKILASKRTRIPSNTFFTDVHSDVQVIRRIRGEAEDVVKVAYPVELSVAQSPYRIGETYVFCIFVKSLAEPGVYLVGKILPNTPQNVAAITQEAE